MQKGGLFTVPKTLLQDETSKQSGRKKKHFTSSQAGGPCLPSAPNDVWDLGNISSPPWPQLPHLLRKSWANVLNVYQAISANDREQHQGAAVTQP